VNYFGRYLETMQLDLLSGHFEPGHISDLEHLQRVLQQSLRALHLLEYLAHFRALKQLRLHDVVNCERNSEQHLLTFQEINVPQSHKHVEIKIVREKTSKPLQSYYRWVKPGIFEMVHQLGHRGSNHLGDH
jgi:hypothetical protein